MSMAVDYKGIAKALDNQKPIGRSGGKSFWLAIRTAIEKQIPKKPLHNGANWYRCPNGCEVHKKAFEKDWYCPKCGQRLDLQ